MIRDIGSKFYSALSPHYDLEVKVTDLEVLCYFFLPQRSLDLVFTQLLFRSYYLYLVHIYQLWKTFFIQNYIQYHIFLPPSTLTHTHTHARTHARARAHYDLDFKDKVLLFYLIDKREFRQGILSGDRSC